MEWGSICTIHLSSPEPDYSLLLYHKGERCRGFIAGGWMCVEPEGGGGGICHGHT